MIVVDKKNNSLPCMDIKMTNLNQLLASACGNGNLSKVKELVEQGVDINADNHYSIRIAVEIGHLEIVKYLVEQAKDTSYTNYTLNLAAAHGHLEIVKYLIDKKADIHIGNDSSLRWAAIYGHLEVINYLRSVAGNKWKCFDCIVRATCFTLCKDWNKNV